MGGCCEGWGEPGLGGGRKGQPPHGAPARPARLPSRSWSPSTAVSALVRSQHFLPRSLRLSICKMRDGGGVGGGCGEVNQVLKFEDPKNPSLMCSDTLYSFRLLAFFWKHGATLGKGGMACVHGRMVSKVSLDTSRNTGPRLQACEARAPA